MSTLAAAASTAVYLRVTAHLGPFTGVNAALGLPALLGLLLPRPRPLSHRTRRGRQILAPADAEARAGRLRRPNDAGLPWGGIRLPSDAAAAHAAVVGATGSGKTITLRLLMQAALSGSVPGMRAVVYDAKQDVLPLLIGMGVRQPVSLLHPFDARGRAWDVAADCTAPATALQIASILIPVEEGPNRFFADAARDLLTAALIAFGRLAPRRWTFRDVVCVLKEPGHLSRLLALCPQTADRLHYFREERTFQNIFGTLCARMAWYEPVAACWHRSEEAVSLTRWVKDGGVLVLGNDDAARTAIDAVNRAVFQRLTELLLSGPESRTTTTWVFLDEVREAGKLDGLGRLLTKGRSKGVAVVLGFQAIEGMRDVYGDRLADELVGQCGNKAVLRLESPETAEWASRLFGDQEVFDRSRSESAAGLGTPTATVTDSPVRRPSVLPSELLDLPRAGRANGVTGYYLSSAVGAYRGRLPWADVERQLRPPAADVPAFVPRPDEDQFLVAWVADDWERLGVPQQDGLPADEVATRRRGKPEKGDAASGSSLQVLGGSKGPEV
ncbi:MAG: type IV secretion system DNA-binding domain-containing protein [Gemmataceae bacterium]|nr:type IV secretion system DNA-binding domain-containing protein [Gemmataceae bacterium]